MQLLQVFPLLLDTEREVSVIPPCFMFAAMVSPCVWIRAQPNPTLCTVPVSDGRWNLHVLGITCSLLSLFYITSCGFFIWENSWDSLPCNTLNTASAAERPYNTDAKSGKWLFALRRRTCKADFVAKPLLAARPLHCRVQWQICLCMLWTQVCLGLFKAK